MQIRRRRGLCYALSLILFSSCNPVFISSIEKKYDTLPFDEEIIVLELNEEPSGNFELLGEAKIRDGGFSSRCNKEALVDIAKREARRLGGNLVQITTDKKPNFWNSCHRLDIRIIRKPIR
ncbi:MAG: hypothetical protein AAF717_14035 [Bacteroidota bacterium]